MVFYNTSFLVDIAFGNMHPALVMNIHPALIVKAEPYLVA